jgi:Flp pilus assembly protein TadG
VEFALVAPIFFALLFAIIETGLVFFAGQVLETGTQDSGRLIFTQNNPTQAEDFKQDLCNRVSLMFDCSQLYVDVQTHPKGIAFTIADPIDGAGNFVNNFVYLPSKDTSSTVVVRAFYKWPVFVTGLGYNIGGRGDMSSKHLLAATAAFRPN